MNYSNNVSYLDRIRINEGANNLTSAFDYLYKNNQSKALQLLNAENLSFPCLFLLLPQINEFNLLGNLSWRNLYAAKFCTNTKMPFHNQASYSTLKWIFISGEKEENMSNEFDEVLDKSVAQLLITYKDKTILPMVSELIFKRHMKGKYIHDLVWCLFQSKETKTMPLIANYIHSHNDSDSQLAYKLLNFKPELQPNDKEQQYNNFNEWLKENRSFIYPTGDSMQQTSAPKYWRVNLTAKYLCNGSISNKADVNQFKGAQQKRINEFEKLERSDQKMLSKYSFRTYKRNFQAWNSFINSPISTQIQMAKAELGGTK